MTQEQVIQALRAQGQNDLADMLCGMQLVPGPGSTSSHSASSS